jgi:dynein heavy chain, axonemal
MLSMRFVDRVRAESETLYKKLQYFENLLNEWLNFQRTWMYLENIFNSADIALKMGGDAKRFFQIDNLWKDIMKQTNSNPLISRVMAGYN